MNKINYSTFKKTMYDYNKSANKDKLLTGVVVISPASFTKEYPLESRSYVVTSKNKAFNDMGGYSIFASSLDKTDPHVRLEQYLAVECGPEDGWEVEYCYFLD